VQTWEVVRPSKAFISKSTEQRTIDLVFGVRLIRSQDTL